MRLPFGIVPSFSSQLPPVKPTIAPAKPTGKDLVAAIRAK